MDSAGDAVLELHVELGEGVRGVHGGLAKISLGRGIDDVAHVEALDGLVLRDLFCQQKYMKNLFRIMFYVSKYQMMKSEIELIKCNASRKPTHDELYVCQGDGGTEFSLRFL